MRKLILQEFVTLDGMAAESDGGTAFVPGSLQGDVGFQAEQERLIESANTMVLGRKTYEMFSEYWPAVKEREEKEFADKLNGMDKIVISNTLKNAPWGEWEPAKVVSGRAEDELAKVKEQPGSDMLIWGSISLSQSLIKAGVIDEIRIVTCPLVLGEGRTFFGDKIGSLDLKLKDAKTFDSGAVEIIYVPERVAESDKAKMANP
jgi:dihydrofolate reductase